MWIKDAIEIAERLRAAMEPYCDRPPEIAGSIRRRCQGVNDIEIVALPKWELAPVEEQVRDLFGTPTRAPENFNLLHFWATKLAHEAGVSRWIKPGRPGKETGVIKPDGKYWKAVVNEGGGDEIGLDLFLPRPGNYGLIKLIRTGSKDFSAAVLGHAKRHTPYMTESAYYEMKKLKGEPEGYLVERKTGTRVETREEEEVFRLLALAYVEPPERVNGRSLRPLAKCGGCSAMYERPAAARHNLCAACVVVPFGKEVAAQ